MNKKITLTPNNILNAVTYVPVMEKIRFVNAVANNCVEAVNVVMNKSEDETIPLPPYSKENIDKKSRYLMGALLKYYLNLEYEPTEDEFLMSADEYDNYASSHIYNQLERMKSHSAEVRNIIFDILADLRDIERRLNAEIHTTIGAQNDVGTRLMIMIQMQSSPEALQNSLEALQNVKGDIDKYLSERDWERDDENES